MRRPRLKRTRELLVTAARDIYILRPDEGSDLVIEQPDSVTRELLMALDGSRSTPELEREFGAERVGDALGQLSELGLLDDAADDERVTARELARYDRQLRYFSDLATGSLAPSDYQQRLREARVLILGLGGLGSWAAYALGCCGVGELGLLDGDLVEESNFNRQILYRERDIGRSKAEAATEALADFDSRCRLTPVARRLESVAAVREEAEGFDFVVNGADWPAHDIERWVNAACFDSACRSSP